MNNVLETQLHVEPMGLTGFLILFPVLILSCFAFLLVSGVLMAPVCIAWLIYDAAREELDFFSFPMVLLSITKDFAAFVGLKQETALIPIDQTKIIHPRRQSFISDFSEPEEISSNRSSHRKNYHISSTRINAAAPKTITNIAHRDGSYPIFSIGISRNFNLQSNIIRSLSPNYHSTASTLSIKGLLGTPEQKPFDFSKRNISPHWSAGKQTTKSDTPSPLELSPCELEYSEYVPSPKRWPSPVSNTEYPITRGDSLGTRLQKAKFLENAESVERIFITDDAGSTHILGIDGFTQKNAGGAENVQNINQSRDYISNISQKLERKLFTTKCWDKTPVDLNSSLISDDSVYKKTGSFPPIDYNNKASLTTGWSSKYKDLITEMKLKGSLGKHEDDDENQPKIENYKPIIDVNPHWMDTPRLEPLERPRLNKLQRWGLVHRTSRVNLNDQVIEEVNRRSMTPIPNDLQSLRASPITLKEHYNFGNLEMSPEKRGGQSDSEDEYSKYWEGFDEAYNIYDSKSPGSRSDEEEKWKLSMGKWAEKGVEVMKPVNEEGRDDGNAILSLDPRIAIRWPSPISQSSEREHLLRDSPTSEDENINCNYLVDIEDTKPRTPSPLLLLSALGEKTDALGDNNKDSNPPVETSGRLFGRRIARAPRLPASSSPAFVSPPRPLPVKLIRMFEDLSKPLPIGPRSSSINSSPERIHSPPDRNESHRPNEVRGLGIDTGNNSQAKMSRAFKKSLVLDPRGEDDGLNECF